MWHYTNRKSALEYLDYYCINDYKGLKEYAMTPEQVLILAEELLEREPDIIPGLDIEATKAEIFEAFTRFEEELFMTTEQIVEESGQWMLES